MGNEQRHSGARGHDAHPGRKFRRTRHLNQIGRDRWVNETVLPQSETEVGSVNGTPTTNLTPREQRAARKKEKIAQAEATRLSDALTLVRRFDKNGQPETKNNNGQDVHRNGEIVVGPQDDGLLLPHGEIEVGSVNGNGAENGSQENLTPHDKRAAMKRELRTTTDAQHLSALVTEIANLLKRVNQQFVMAALQDLPDSKHE